MSEYSIQKGLVEVCYIGDLKMKFSVGKKYQVFHEKDYWSGGRWGSFGRRNISFRWDSDRLLKFSCLNITVCPSGVKKWLPYKQYSTSAIGVVWNFFLVQFSVIKRESNGTRWLTPILKLLRCLVSPAKKSKNKTSPPPCISDFSLDFLKSVKKANSHPCKLWVMTYLMIWKLIKARASDMRALKYSIL